MCEVHVRVSLMVGVAVRASHAHAWLLRDLQTLLSLCVAAHGGALENIPTDSLQLWRQSTHKAHARQHKHDANNTPRARKRTSIRRGGPRTCLLGLTTRDPLAIWSCQREVCVRRAEVVRVSGRVFLDPKRQCRRDRVLLCPPVPNDQLFCPRAH